MHEGLAWPKDVRRMPLPQAAKATAAVGYERKMATLDPDVHLIPTVCSFAYWEIRIFLMWLLQRAQPCCVLPISVGW